MRTGGAMVLVVIGLVLLWIVVTGRLDRLVAAWGTLQGDTTGTGTTATDPALQINGPAVPTTAPAGTYAAATEIPPAALTFANFTSAASRGPSLVRAQAAPAGSWTSTAARLS